MTQAMFKLDTDSIQKMAFFESITKTSLRDCIEGDNDLIFIVNSENLGKAIGKKGSNIKLLERRFNKKIILIGFDNDPSKFMENLLKPIQLKTINLDEDDNLNVVIKSSSRAFPSKKVKKAKTLLKKYFPSIKEVNVKV